MDVVGEMQLKLNQLSGPGKLSARIWTAKCRLGWHNDGDEGRIKRLIYGEYKQIPHEIIEAVRVAHARWCADQIEANRKENNRLIAEITRFLKQAEHMDPDFLQPHLEALRTSLYQLGKQVDPSG